MQNPHAPASAAPSVTRKSPAAMRRSTRTRFGIVHLHAFRGVLERTPVTAFDYTPAERHQGRSEQQVLGFHSFSLRFLQ